MKNKFYVKDKSQKRYWNSGHEKMPNCETYLFKKVALLHLTDFLVTNIILHNCINVLYKSKKIVEQTCPTEKR